MRSLAYYMPLHTIHIAKSGYIYTVCSSRIPRESVCTTHKRQLVLHDLEQSSRPGHEHQPQVEVEQYLAIVDRLNYKGRRVSLFVLHRNTCDSGRTKPLFLELSTLFIHRHARAHALEPILEQSWTSRYLAACRVHATWVFLPKGHDRAWNL